MPIQVPDILWC